MSVGDLGLVAIVELIGCMLVCIRDIRGFLFGGLVPVLCSTPVIFLEPFGRPLKVLFGCVLVSSQSKID